MGLIIALVVYFVIGTAYIGSTPNIGYKGEWLGNILLSFIWPYFMLVRFFKHSAYIAEQKRLKAYNDAHP